MRIPELDRLNELARKHQKTGLNEAEKTERAVLRKAYLRQFRGQICGVLATVTVVDEQGQDVTPEKLRRAQETGELIPA